MKEFLKKNWWVIVVVVILGILPLVMPELEWNGHTLPKGAWRWLWFVDAIIVAIVAYPHVKAFMDRNRVTAANTASESSASEDPVTASGESTNDAVARRIKILQAAIAGDGNALDLLKKEEEIKQKRSDLGQMCLDYNEKIKELRENDDTEQNRLEALNVFNSDPLN